MEFETEEDINGQDCENSKLRRLYRVMNIPTSDLLNRKSAGMLQQVKQSYQTEED